MIHMEPSHLNPRPAQDIDYDAIGRAAFEAAQDLPEPAWEEIDYQTRSRWIEAGRAAVAAYDAQLTGQADSLAERLLNGPETGAQVPFGCAACQAGNHGECPGTMESGSICPCYRSRRVPGMHPRDHMLPQVD